MAERTIRQLQKSKEALLNQLQYLTIEHTNLYKQFQQLGQHQPADLAYQLANFQQQIQETHLKIAQLNEECQKAVCERKKRDGVIREFEEKGKKLNKIIAAEKTSLQSIISGNEQIEQSIKVIRDEYELLQEEIYHLDTKKDNLKNYGCQEVPPSIVELCIRKQSLSDDLALLDERNNTKSKQLNQMFLKEEAEELKEKIEMLRKRKGRIEQLKKENQILLKQNEKLNQAKNQHEWTPNQQLTNLDNFLLKQENKINQVQKDIGSLHKKTADCTHKIQQFKKYLRKNQKQLQTGDSDTQLLGRTDQGKFSIFEQIKKDIRREQTGQKKKRSRGKHSPKQVKQEQSKPFWQLSQAKVVEAILLLIILGCLGWWLLRVFLCKK